jgi:hypothetical protein
MHFEDALRLQQEDSEQRKGKKKGKPLTVSGGSECAKTLAPPSCSSAISHSGNSPSASSVPGNQA